MKTISLLKVALIALPLAFLASCKSSKSVTTVTPMAPRSMELQETLNKVLENQQTAKLVMVFHLLLEYVAKYLAFMFQTMLQNHHSIFGQIQIMQDQDVFTRV